MRLEHTVQIPADIDEVWRFLDDIHAVAACMPGAELTETVDDSTFRGLVKLSIGPLAMNYAGGVNIVERDDAEHRLLLDASGRERRGSGTAKASIDLKLDAKGSETSLKVVSDIQLTGRIASLGRGVRDVSNKLFFQFAERLANELNPGVVGVSDGAVQQQGDDAATSEPATRHQAARSPRRAADRDSNSIKLTSLVWSVTRERLADLLHKLSIRVRPHQ